MRRADPRLGELFYYLRRLVDVLEELANRPTEIAGLQKTSEPEKPISKAPEATPENLAYSAKEACKLAGVSRTMLYRAVGNRELRAVKCSRRTMILASDLRRWIESWPESTGGRVGMIQRP